jgi:hypothetical protein
MGRGYLNERATGGAVKPSPDVGGRFGRGKVPSLGKEGRVVVKKEVIGVYSFKLIF